jgi:hypothetical protein
MLPGKSCYAVVALGLLLSSLTLGCVGSETGGRSSGADLENEEEHRVSPGDRATAFAYADTVSPLDYQIFNSVNQSGSPKKVLYRLLVMQPGSDEALGKTLRVALDSIAEADSSLAAARAILYVFQRTGRAEGKLVPRVWGEWVPLEGWDSMVARSRKQPYRLYIYHGNPGWGEDSHG